MSCGSGNAAGIGNLRRLWTVVFVSPWMSMPLAGRSRHTWTTTVTTISLALYHRRRALKPSRTMTLSIVQSGQCGARIVAFVEATDGEMSAGIVTPTRAARLSCRTRRRRPGPSSTIQDQFSLLGADSGSYGLPSHQDNPIGFGSCSNLWAGCSRIDIDVVWVDSSHASHDHP